MTLFGSRVRGDYNEKSDLDILIDRHDPRQISMDDYADWLQQTDTDFLALREQFPYFLDIIFNYSPDGQTMSYIRAGRPLPELTLGKVGCVRTERKPPDAKPR